MEKEKKKVLGTPPDNQALEAAIREFLADKNNVTMGKLMAAMKETRFIVPADLPPELKKEVLEKAKQGEKVKFEKPPRMMPIMVQNQRGEQFAPAYSSEEQMQKVDKFPLMLSVTVDELLRISSDPKLELKGIILNPDTDKVILHQKFIEAMKQIKAGNVPPKPGQPRPIQKIQMSRAQFEIVARKNCEWGIIPKMAHTRKAEFMAELDEKRGEFMAQLYQKPYGKLPCPWKPEDFDVMMLNIDEDTQVAMVELPKRTVVPQTALSMYIVWFHNRDEVYYFVIEQGAKDEDNVLCCVRPDGRREELMTAPPAGSELAAVLDLIREEQEEELDAAEVSSDENENRE